MTKEFATQKVLVIAGATVSAFLSSCDLRVQSPPSSFTHDPWYSVEAYIEPGIAGWTIMLGYGRNIWIQETVDAGLGGIQIFGRFQPDASKYPSPPVSYDVEYWLGGKLWISAFMCQAPGQCPINTETTLPNLTGSP